MNAMLAGLAAVSSTNTTIAALASLGPLTLTVILISLVVSFLLAMFCTLFLIICVTNWFDARTEQLWKHTEKEK